MEEKFGFNNTNEINNNQVNDHFIDLTPELENDRLVDPRPGWVEIGPQSNDLVYEYAEEKGLEYNNKLEKEPETYPEKKLLARDKNTIYIFTHSKQLGIKFSALGTPELGLGIFEADPTSITTVEWDEEVNSRDNTLFTRTFKVSEDDFLRILSSIIRQKGKDRIFIDLGNSFEMQANNFKDELSNNSKDELSNNSKDELVRLREQLVSFVPKNDYNNKNYDDYSGFWNNSDFPDNYAK